MDWLLENYDLIVSAVMAALTLATAITRLTDTPEDDRVVAKIWGLFSMLEHRNVGGTKLPLTRTRRRR